ncbi:MAG: hypothetical protein IPG89_14080 [Bacteroidetes bacterium]|nr:hypothetical protein [Bacteroidota bacterium]
MLFYQREVNKKGKIKEYNPQLINDFELIKANHGDFFVQMQESFWMIDAERLNFTYGSKTIKFGIQLNDKEAETVFKELKKELKKY